MKKIAILSSLLALCFLIAAQAQNAAPKPGPELKQLSVLAGQWTFKGESMPGPLGPAGTISGDFTARMILGGFFLQTRFTRKVATQEAHGLVLYGYHPGNKNYPTQFYMDDGSTFVGECTVSNNAYAFSGNLVIAGKPYQFRTTFTLAPDLMGATYKEEISSDGKTWTPVSESKWTKAKPAAKK